MSNIIAIPLNKLTRSARNVRKSGGDSIDDLATWGSLLLCVYREYCLGTSGVSLQWFDLKRDQPAFLAFCRNRHRR
jgi:hypothetical protein